MRHILSVLAVLLFTTMTAPRRHQADLTDTGKTFRPEDDQEKATPANGEVRVSIKNTEFRPAEITIASGVTVVWVNDDSFSHSVTAGTHENPSGLFDSETIEGEGTFRHTFEDTGSYRYLCKFHPDMIGRVIVQEES